MATEMTLEKTNTQPRATEHTRGGRHYVPNVDIFETPEELIVLADFPGASGQDIDIDFENGELSIHGKVKERQPEGTTYLLREYGIGDFHRTFQISERIDTARIPPAEGGSGQAKKDRGQDGMKAEVHTMKLTKWRNK